MAGALELVAESLKKSFDLRLWLCYLLISFLNIVVFFLTIVILLIPAATIYYVFSVDTVSIVLWTILAVIGVILFLYIGAIVWAITLFIAKDFSEKGKISLNESWNSALQRAPPLFLATTIIFCLFGILLALLLWPSIVPIADAFSSIPPDAILDPQSFAVPFMQSLLALTAMLGFFFLIVVVVSPFTVLVAPTVVFENISAFDGIKKAIVAAKENYLHNILSVILYFIVVMIISGFFFLVGAGLNLFSIPLSAVSGFPIFRLVLEIINFILQVFSMIILMAFISVFSVNYYKANFFKFADEKKTVPEKEEKEKEPEEPREPKNGLGIPSEKETQAIKLEPWMGKKI